MGEKLSEQLVQTKPQSVQDRIKEMMSDKRLTLEERKEISSVLEAMKKSQDAVIKQTIQDLKKFAIDNKYTGFKAKLEAPVVPEVRPAPVVEIATAPVVPEVRPAPVDTPPPEVAPTVILGDKLKKYTPDNMVADLAKEFKVGNHVLTKQDYAQITEKLQLAGRSLDKIMGVNGVVGSSSEITMDKTKLRTEGFDDLGKVASELRLAGFNLKDAKIQDTIIKAFKEGDIRNKITEAGQKVAQSAVVAPNSPEGVERGTLITGIVSKEPNKYIKDGKVAELQKMPIEELRKLGTVEPVKVEPVRSTTTIPYSPLNQEDKR
ncbi:MAG: hypothetical protein WC774_04470 [Candidatus Gracilibacteria bacterium]